MVFCVVGVALCVPRIRNAPEHLPEEYFQNTVRFTSLSEGNPADRYNIGAGLGYPAPGTSWGLEGTVRF